MKKFTILTTNDMHSSFTGSGGPDFNLESVDRIGGYSRLATAINVLRSHYESLGHQVLLFDAGDFYSGSLFQLLSPCADVKWCPELEYFTLMKYDAITLGNHDFEIGEEALMNSFTKLDKQQLGFNLNIISSNLRVKRIDETKKINEEEEIKKQNIAKDIRNRVNDYIILKKGDITFGIIGAMGPDAAFSCSSTRSYVGFIGYDEKLQAKKMDLYTNFIIETATKIRSEVDVVILLAHQGSPEDTDLAKEVPIGLIDIMISGHTHETYLKKVRGKESFFERQKLKHKTFITQNQSHGKRLGVNNFYFKGNELMHSHLDEGENKIEIKSIPRSARSTPKTTPKQTPKPTPTSTPKPTPISTPKSTPRSSTQKLPTSHINYIPQRSNILNNHDNTRDLKEIHEQSTISNSQVLEVLLSQIEQNKSFVDINHLIKKTDYSIDQKIHVWSDDVNIAKKTNIKEKDSLFYNFKIHEVIYKSPEVSSPHEDLFTLPSVANVQLAPIFCTLMLEELNKYHTQVSGRQTIEVYLHAPAAVRDDLLSSSDSFTVLYSDVFRILSMTGQSPVCSFFLSIEHVAIILEIIPILRTFFSPEISVSFSNTITWEERAWGIPFINKIYNIKINGETKPPNSLVHIASNYFIGEWFWKVKQMTHDLVNLKPMNSLGEPTPFKMRCSSIITPQVYETDLVCGALSRKVNERDQFYIDGDGDGDGDDIKNINNTSKTTVNRNEKNDSSKSNSNNNNDGNISGGGDGDHSDGDNGNANDSGNGGKGDDDNYDVSSTQEIEAALSSLSLKTSASFDAYDL